MVQILSQWNAIHKSRPFPVKQDDSLQVFYQEKWTLGHLLESLSVTATPCGRSSIPVEMLLLSAAPTWLQFLQYQGPSRRALPVWVSLQEENQQPLVWVIDLMRYEEGTSSPTSLLGGRGVKELRRGGAQEHDLWTDRQTVRPACHFYRPNSVTQQHPPYWLIPMYKRQCNSLRKILAANTVDPQEKVFLFLWCETTHPTWLTTCPPPTILLALSRAPMKYFVLFANICIRPTSMTYRKLLKHPVC